MTPIALTLVERRMVVPFTEMETVGSRLAGVEISSERVDFQMIRHQNISDSHPLDGSVGTQGIYVNVFRGTASIRDNKVLNEWDGILDFKNALLEAKLFSKMACVLAKMDEGPTLDDISKALDHQVILQQYPTTQGLTYAVLPSRVKNLAQYGVPIKDVCRQVPTYFAQEQKEGTALAIDPNSCFEVQILSFLRLSICGEFPGL
ncbi:LOW QUALITY PROTEIN: gastrokine-3-like [Megaptera novaeangliae]